MRINDCTTLERDGGIAIITVDSPPVNSLSVAVRKGVAEAMMQAAGDSAVAAVVLICGGRTFFAGADITEFGKPVIEPDLRALQQIVEDMPKPVIAAIHGAALGGGLELALVAHGRIAVPSAQCGLPEVRLGLMPGAGGTQRLPRVVGAARALEMMTSGDPISAAEAARLGLLDRIADEGALRDEAVAFARAVAADGAPLARIRDRPLVVEQGLFDAFREANGRKFRGLMAPESIIRSVEQGIALPFPQALENERALFCALLEGAQSAALRHVFFAQRQAAKVDAISADTPIRPIIRVGVVGAGTMGGGIAMNFANVGLPVTIVETRQEALDRGLRIIRRNYENSAKKGKLTAEQVAQRMACLTGSLALEDLADCDLVIEAVFEQLDVKQELFRRLDLIAKPSAIVATNTSYLDIDRIAEVTGRPENVLGLHFFSPANVMRLLEIVKAAKTDLSVLATAVALAKKIGKIGVVVGNCYGFVGNRMLAARHAQAEAVVTEGALPWDVDRVIRDFGFAMGPFEMRDLVGLDVGWNRATSSGATVREMLNEMGRHGQKTGGGYYDYDEKRQPTPSPIAEQAVLDFSERHGGQRRIVSDEEIRDRVLLAMVNEGAKILDEGIAQRSSDIDLVWINGYGWPAYRGGPMYWADTVGLPVIRDKLKALHATHGEVFRLSPLIERLVAQGKDFASL
ncbi:putative fatty acid oxidation complex alpha subunit [Caenibius tardaugens NBRC 16725]|uniref:Putative fatty acid oxidation complex alpha subunit n=1 Tax=Caenibius tardaugens NBRC 16725 TaxID=1219035 RepID=U2YQB9_9SPHN|nr:3-hydroxyacyl-CoA dehydrogenase NAD-binding domain-containing protein [Caenibius tardaugens]AZI35317.1 3-hydroxyacyl-CoA dehydrogenase [Caenibius tardaugens NBRC 16725]GAD51160.1 putative fatty acid oxidation complex alpha subunit [Caenibius tardaugens NBRC 16725]